MKIHPLVLLLFLAGQWPVLAAELPRQYLNLPLKSLSGETITLAELKGKKPVYLKFWASWCQPCRKQMPHLQHTFETYGNDIQIISVNLGVNDDLASIMATQKEFALSVPIVIDKTGELSQAFNLLGTPYHILLDKNANIVHSGHDASAELDSKIKLLAQGTKLKQTHVAAGVQASGPDIQTPGANKISALFFVATWCDWYLEKSRPAMSRNCIEAQNSVNSLYTKFPQIQWKGVASRLWTGEKELREYKDKYNVRYPLAIDVTNNLFLDFNVKNFPTLILLKNGKQVYSTNDFMNAGQLSDKINQVLNNKTM